jgi:hypothetical protein
MTGSYLEVMSCDERVFSLIYEQSSQQAAAYGSSGFWNSSVDGAGGAEAALVVFARLEMNPAELDASCKLLSTWARRALC